MLKILKCLLIHQKILEWLVIGKVFLRLNIFLYHIKTLTIQEVCVL